MSETRHFAYACQVDLVSEIEAALRIAKKTTRLASRPRPHGRVKEERRAELPKLQQHLEVLQGRLLEMREMVQQLSGVRKVDLVGAVDD